MNKLILSCAIAFILCFFGMAWYYSVYHNYPPSRQIGGYGVDTIKNVDTGMIRLSVHGRIEDTGKDYITVVGDSFFEGCDTGDFGHPCPIHVVSDSPISRRRLLKDSEDYEDSLADYRWGPVSGPSNEENMMKLPNPKDEETITTPYKKDSNYIEEWKGSHLGNKRSKALSFSSAKSSPSKDTIKELIDSTPFQIKKEM